MDTSSPNALMKFYVEKGEQKLDYKEWVIPDPPEEYNGKPVMQA